jgi:hypothetical protein
MATSPKVSRGLRVLSSNSYPKSIDDEDANLRKEAIEIENAWQSSRWKYTERSYKGMF